MAAGDVVTPDIQRVGRWFYEVRLDIQPGDNWISMTSEPPSQVFGMRWARWKARRLLAAELRSERRWRR